MIIDIDQIIIFACLLRQRARLIESMRLARFLMLGPLLFAGCGERLPVAPVSGNPGPGSFGRSDEQGRFELELVKPARKGAIIGEHRVMISPAADATSRTQRQQSAEGGLDVWIDDPRANRQAIGSDWPARYTDGSLSLQVPTEGTDKANFDLTAKP